MNADYVRRIAVWLIQEGWTTNARRDGFPPLLAPLFPLACARFALKVADQPYGFRLYSLGLAVPMNTAPLMPSLGGRWREAPDEGNTLSVLWAVCKREALPNSRESFLSARGAPPAPARKAGGVRGGCKTCAAGCTSSSSYAHRGKAADHKSKNQL